MKNMSMVGAVLIASLLLTACATQSGLSGASGEQSAFVPLKEEPGEVTFGSVDADLLYQLMLAEIATQRGDMSTAAKFYVHAAKTTKDPRIASRAVRVSSFAQMKGLALEAAEIWLEGDPENTEAIRVLTVLNLRNGKYLKAEEQLKKLLQLEPDKISSNLLRVGAMLQREAENKHAAEIAKHIVDIYPQYAESQYVAATLLLTINEMDEALIHIKKSLAIRDDWADAVTLRARIFLLAGDIDGALSFLHDFLMQHPSEDLVRFVYSRALLDAKKLVEARSQFELLAVKMPDNEDVLFTLAMLSLQFKDLEEAIGYLQQLISLGKTSPQIHYYLGQISEQKEEYVQALDWYSRVRVGEYRLESQLRTAVVLSKSKSIDDAIAHLQALAVADEIEQRQVLLFEATLLKEHKRYRQAYDLYTSALKKTPKDPELLYSRSLVAERLDMIDQVVKDLGYVIESDPKNAAALNALGYTLADRTTDLPKALEYITRAYELEPDDPAIIDSLGWVQFRLGNIEQAAELLKKAMDMIEDGEVAAHYGEVLWELGRTNEAVKIWRQAKEQFSDNDTLIKTMERFGQ